MYSLFWQDWCYIYIQTVLAHSFSHAGLLLSPLPGLPGAEWEPVDSEAGEAGVADPSEGVSAADAGGGGGQPAAEAAAVLRAAVPPVQEEDAARSPQPGAGPAERGTAPQIQLINNNNNNNNI